MAPIVFVQFLIGSHTGATSYVQRRIAPYFQLSSKLPRSVPIKAFEAFAVCRVPLPSSWRRITCVFQTVASMRVLGSTWLLVGFSSTYGLRTWQRWFGPLVLKENVQVEGFVIPQHVVNGSPKLDSQGIGRSSLAVFLFKSSRVF